MVIARYMGRIGNQLFIYCFARILAEELGLALSADGIDGFNGTFQRVYGDVFEHPTRLINGTEIVNLEHIISNRLKGKIIVNGYLQRASYYLKYRKRIQQWLWTPPSRIKLGANEVVVPLRLGDFCAYSRVIRRDYYERILAEHKFGCVWITSDEPEHQYVKHFERLGARVFRGAPMEHFAFIRDAPNIILCLSTFSWWTAFLSEANRIFFPVLHDKMDASWSNESCIDLRVNMKNYINSNRSV
jgi:hypothetical protein